MDFNRVSNQSLTKGAGISMFRGRAPRGRTDQILNVRKNGVGGHLVKKAPWKTH